MTRIVLLLIRLYQLILSPWMGQQCRFHPTCSCYTRDAVVKHGVLPGLALGTLRILRCQPWGGSGGLDPVPERFAWGDLIRYNRKQSLSSSKD